ncbi:MAG TPA: hypothetical protein VFT99_22410 [Roseiflexaceae bacterium]|nr:hypothetical protein [Roseiflexaceae bacterium]
MPKWSDFGGMWNTLREMDVSSIRDEAERPIAIRCVGHETVTGEVVRLLHQGPQRYPLSGPSPISLATLDRTVVPTTAPRTDLLLVALDARQPLHAADSQALAQLGQLPVPAVVVMLYETALPATSQPLIIAPSARSITIADPQALGAPDQLATAVFDRLPEELHLAAARRLPGLRAVYARQLIAATSFTNATYALASGLPEQIPILSVPFAAADILVLTKNQAVLVYRLALAYGAAPDFQARLREVVPVIGGAFLWRQAARSLIGLIPFWGLVPKIAVAYGGTYTTGVVAWRWYENGEMVSADQMKRISSEALAIGRARATELIERAKQKSDALFERAGRSAKQLPAPGENGRIQRAVAAVRERLPFGKRKAKR